MPTLGQLRCHLKWQGTELTLPEYNTEYHDSHVEAWIGVPPNPTAFFIHLTSQGWIASGLATFVYIDGEYMCNRLRKGIPFPGPDVHPDNIHVDFKLRQKEVTMADGAHFGMPWSFAKVNAAPEGLEVSDVLPWQGEHVGTIEIVVLRLAPETANLPRGLQAPGQSPNRAQSVLPGYTGPPRFGIDGACDTDEDCDIEKHPSKRPHLMCFDGSSGWVDTTWQRDHKEKDNQNQGWDLGADDGTNAKAASRAGSSPKTKATPAAWGGGSAATGSKKASRKGSKPVASRRESAPVQNITINVAAGGSATVGPPPGSTPRGSPALIGSRSKGTSSPTSETGWGGRKAGFINESPKPSRSKGQMPGSWANENEAQDPTDWDTAPTHAENDFWGENGNNDNDQNDQAGWNGDNDDRNNPEWTNNNDHDNSDNQQAAPWNSGKNDENQNPFESNGDGGGGGDGAWGGQSSHNQQDNEGNAWGGGSQGLEKHDHNVASSSNELPAQPQVDHNPSQPPLPPQAPALASDGPPLEPLHLNITPQKPYTPALQARPDLFAMAPGNKPKPYWAAWKQAQDQQAAFTAPVFDPRAGQQAVYSIPTDVLDRNMTTHQVQLGLPGTYVKPKHTPKYLDTMDKPYAVFTFHYRDQATLSIMLQKDVRELQAAEIARLKALSKDEILRIMYERTSNLGRGVAGPRAPSHPAPLFQPAPPQQTQDPQPSAAAPVAATAPPPLRAASHSHHVPSVPKCTMSGALPVPSQRGSQCGGGFEMQNGSGNFGGDFSGRNGGDDGGENMVWGGEAPGNDESVKPPGSAVVGQGDVQW